MREPDEPSADAAPPSFVCPLTLELMKDPVTAADGHSYECDAITRELTAALVELYRELDLEDTRRV